MQIALLANPWSGRGVGPARARRIATMLDGKGWRTEVHVSDSRSDTVHWGSQVHHSADRVVVVGGDGTLNAVVEGMTEEFNHALPPVLQVGLGTANLLTHELGLPRRSRRLAEVVQHGQAQAFDLGHLLLDAESDLPTAPRPCVLVWDFGLGGALMKAMDEVRTGPIRRSDYAGLLFRLLRTWKPSPQRVVADGVDLGEFEYGIVSGIRTYAASAFRFPPCRYDDGLWELFLMRKLRPDRVASFATRGALRRIHRMPGLVRVRAREVQVFGDQASPVQIDGDFVGHTPVEFRLSGRTLPILRPARA